MAKRTIKSGKSNKRASLECDKEHKHRNTVTYKKVVATSNVYHQTDEYKKIKVVEKSIIVVASYEARTPTPPLVLLKK